MAKNPYSVLGVPETATQSEINDAYRIKKEKLQDMRFLEGEAGAAACEGLNDLEVAYHAAIEKASASFSIGEENALYLDVENLIKGGRIEEAQAKLNSLPNYTAEWHYYQSVIYFRKSWHLDAKKQLELALTLDPGNQKYQESLNELVKAMTAPENPQQAGQQAGQQPGQGGFYQNQQNPQGRSYQGQNDPNQQQGNMRGCSACDCCQGMVCADCCCECMGGDLISCC